jgi:hypothetical protein
MQVETICAHARHKDAASRIAASCGRELEAMKAAKEKEVWVLPGTCSRLRGCPTYTGPRPRKPSFQQN